MGTDMDCACGMADMAVSSIDLLMPAPAYDLSRDTAFGSREKACISLCCLIQERPVLGSNDTLIPRLQLDFLLLSVQPLPLKPTVWPYTLPVSSYPYVG